MTTDPSAHPRARTVGTHLGLSILVMLAIDMLLPRKLKERLA